MRGSTKHFPYPRMTRLPVSTVPRLRNCSTRKQELGGKAVSQGHQDSSAPDPSHRLAELQDWLTQSSLFSATPLTE